MTCPVCGCNFDLENNTELVDDPVHDGEQIEVVICPECHNQTSV